MIESHSLTEFDWLTAVVAVMLAYPYDGQQQRQHVAHFPSDITYQRSGSFGAPLASSFSHYAVSQSPQPRVGYSQHGHGAAAVLHQDLPFSDVPPEDDFVSSADGDSPFNLSTFAADDSGSAASEIASFLSLSPHSRASGDSGKINRIVIPSSATPAAPPVSTDSAEFCTASEVPIKKRKRSVAMLSASERLSRRRAQHRAVDTSRRQKEASAVARLLRLIRQQQQQKMVAGGVGVVGVTGEVDADEIVEADEDDIEGDRKRKAGRLTVLESSIALIEQLTAACSTMERACNAKDVQVSRVSGQLRSVAALLAQQARDSLAVASSLDHIAAAGDGRAELSYYHQPQLSYSVSQARHPSSSLLSVLPPSTSSYLAQSDRSYTLSHGGISTLSTLCIAVVSLTPVGVIVDVNDRLLACTGWCRSDLLHTAFADHDTVNKAHSAVAVTPLIADKQLRYVQQYPSYIEQVMTVKSGEKRKAHGTCRYRMVDGTVIETDSTFWGEWDVPLRNGERRSPDRMLLVYEMQDAVVVEA